MADLTRARLQALRRMAEGAYVTAPMIPADLDALVRMAERALDAEEQDRQDKAFNDALNPHFERRVCEVVQARLEDRIIARALREVAPALGSGLARRIAMHTLKQRADELDTEGR